ncbi:MAG: BMP family ABC transporter substrate-binding protein [bacterium]|nr:BMP family ABC transporter substrate-binding protein [bacterium]
MHKKLMALFALLLCLALVAAGCGNDDDSESAPAPVPTEAPAPTEAPEPEPTEAPAPEPTEAPAPEAPTAPSEALISLEQECEAWGGIQAPDGFRVNMVTDIGKVDDGTFNQFAHEGMIGATECFGIEDFSVIETASEADYDANLSTSASENPDALITVGFLLGTDTMLAAEENPNINYIGIDQFHVEYPSNYVGVLFNEHEGGFIAGALAASLSESGVVGVVAGREDVPPVVKFVNGYEAGAKYIDPDIQVLSVYNESFTDPAKGASDAQQFIGDGADVIFGAGGPTGSGGIKAAAEAGAWGIGVDQDEYYTTFNGGSAPGSEYLASSAIKRVDLSVFRNIGAIIHGTFRGGIFVLTAGNLGITYAPFHDAAVSAEAAAAVERVRAGLADGSITTGVCGIDGLFLGEGSLCD